MRTKRVVLLTNRSVLVAGVQRLLQGVSDLELTIMADGDPEAVTKLGALAPQVIVLDSGDTSLGEGVITRMLTENPKSKVIALNLNRTGIEVYRVRRVQHTGFDGLLEAIRGKTISAGPLPREDDPSGEGAP
ncbi:MAG: hypothetical protein HYU86_06080 [Chloroflexi bacterium]|nr:hypothetical protein [Chloroflexota bacterium]